MARSTVAPRMLGCGGQICPFRHVKIYNRFANSLACHRWFFTRPPNPPETSQMNLLRSFGLAAWTVLAEGENPPGGWFGWFDSSWLVPTGQVLLAIVLVLLCIILWGLNLFGLPGNWLAVLMLATYAWLGPQEGRTAISFTPVLAALACALLAEVLEFAAGAVGAKRAGGSRKGTMFAVLGSMVGAVAGAIIGLPIPVLGPVLAAILFAGAGATVGAMYGEWTDGRSWKESWSIGRAAFWGRTFGTLGKVSVGSVIVVITLIAIAF
jgi:uncharacterized protein YqgC (DUF456 family)